LPACCRQETRLWRVGKIISEQGISRSARLLGVASEACFMISGSFRQIRLPCATAPRGAAGRAKVEGEKKKSRVSLL